MQGGGTTTEFEASWQRFCERLECYPAASSDLNPGCTETELAAAETALGRRFPPALRALYLANNGQRGGAKGLFKAVSGYDKYRRALFLDLEAVVRVYRILGANPELDVFEPGLVPFAADHADELADDVFCVDAASGAVYLLWVLAADPFLPADWQTAKFARGPDLAAFVRDQTAMY